MAVTPNYSWPTPDNTDLVRDGAEAIRDLGNAIDSTVDGLATGSFVSLASGTFSGGAVNVTALPQTFDRMVIKWRGVKTTAENTINLRFNNAVTGYSGTRHNPTTGTFTWAAAATTNMLSTATNPGGSGAAGVMLVDYYASAAGTVRPQVSGFAMNGTSAAPVIEFLQTSNRPITEVNFITGSTFNAGTFEIFGVQ